MRSVTNESQAATIVQQIEEAQARTKKGARQLSDLDAEAYSMLALAEQDFDRFLKLVATPPVAVAESAAAQTNAYDDVETVNSRPWQDEALDFTRTFRRLFPAWARQYEQQAQADTNREPFTAEAQAEVSALASELEKLQIELTEQAIPPKQKEACEILERIAALLPKDRNGHSGQNPQPNSGQDQNRQDQNQDQDQNQQDRDLGEQQQYPDERKDEQEDESGPEPEEREDREVEAVLQKAQERNDEHEAEKKARMRRAPLPPNERDW